jgi:hypothetical protein
MSFLNPFFLAALAALAIPLVVHMLSRRRVPVFYFSSLRFLRASDRRSMKRVNLRRVLLMLLRMAGIAFLAIAFARPVVKGELASLFPGGGPVAGCILLDRSYSMGVETDRGTLFEAAKARVREILERFAPEDEVTIILFDSGQERLYRGGGEGRSIGLFLDEAALSCRTTDLRGAVRAALDALRESRMEPRELYIVSDFQRSSLAGSVAAESVRQIEGGGHTARGESSSLPVRAYLVQVGEDPPRNIAVENVMAPGVTLHRGEIATIRAAFTGSGGDAPFSVELHIDGRRILEKEFEMGQSRLARAEFSFPVERSGWLRGEVKKRSDRLRIDDRRFFVLEVVERVPVLLLADERALYLEQALRPEGADTDIELELKRYEELTSDDLDRADIVVLGPGRGLRGREAELIERFVADGGRALVLLLPELEDAVRALSGHTLTIDWMEPAEGFITIRMPVAAPYFLRPLGRETTAEITKLRFGSAALVAGVPGEDALLLFSNGAPFMWEEERGTGSVLFCAIDPVPGAGDLVLSPYFLPIMQQAVLSTRRTPTVEGVLVGESIRWRGRIEGEARCEMPAGWTGGNEAVGQAAVMGVERRERDGRIEELLLPGAEMPGFMTLTAGDDTMAVFAANPDCGLESDLAPATGREAADSLGLEHCKVVGREESISRAVVAGREGREITLQFAAAAILLFVIESLVAQKRYEGGESVG